MKAQTGGMLHEYKRSILSELGMPALLGAGVLLISATLLLGANIAAMRANLARIGNTQQILLAVAAAESGVVGDQLTVRGYALTGDPRFLRYQKNERTRLKRAMEHLTGLTAADHAGAARIANIRRLVKRHMAYYDSITGLGPEHAGIVAKAINDDKKRAIMFQTRGALAAYRAGEVRALGEKQDSLTRQLSQSFYLAVGIVAAAFLLGGLGLVASQLHFPIRHVPRG
jgi:CHASE3 domain sensor protein